MTLKSKLLNFLNKFKNKHFLYIWLINTTASTLLVLLLSCYFNINNIVAFIISFLLYFPVYKIYNNFIKN